MSPSDAAAGYSLSGFEPELSSRKTLSARRWDFLSTILWVCGRATPLAATELAVAEVFASRLLRFILCALPSSLSGSDLFLYHPDLLQPNRCLPQPRDLGLSYAYSSFALCAALFTLIV